MPPLALGKSPALPVANSIAAERAKHAGDSFAAVAMAPIAKELARLVDDVKGLFTDTQGLGMSVDVSPSMRRAGEAWRALQRLVRVEMIERKPLAALDALTKDEMGAVLSELYKAFSTTNPGGEPANAEAKRQLLFFANSLHNRRLAPPPPVAQMRTWSAFTPHYAEDVTYSTAALLGSYADEASLLGLLQSLHPDEWENLCERLGTQPTAPIGHLRPNEQVEVQAWASDRSQVLSRTVRGVMKYGDALRVLARLGGVPEPSVEALVASKFEYVVASQIYDTLKNKSKKEDDKWKARSIDELRHTFPANLRVAYVEFDQAEKAYFSVLLGVEAGPIDGAARDRVLYKVRLPGNPILGEGKPENQNHAIVFTRGEHLQTLDMNQDNYMGESFKMRNLLERFTAGVRIVGFREHIFSESGGAVAHFAASNEFVFGTMVQRFLTWPLMVRFHYGHPDVWDKVWAISSGGISKASRTLHVSEDIFAGFNTVLRGGGIEYAEFIHCGKGRDMGFIAVNGFETKISAGNSLQCCSRDLYRLSKSFDLARLFSMFFSGSGFYGTHWDTSRIWRLTRAQPHSSPRSSLCSHHDVHHLVGVHVRPRPAPHCDVRRRGVPPHPLQGRRDRRRGRAPPATPADRRAAVALPAAH